MTSISSNPVKALQEHPHFWDRGRGPGNSSASADLLSGAGRFYEAWPRHRKLPRLHKLRIQFGDPIYPPKTIGNPEETYKELTEKLRSTVVEMWEKMR